MFENQNTYCVYFVVFVFSIDILDVRHDVSI